VSANNRINSGKTVYGIEQRVDLRPGNSENGIDSVGHCGPNHCFSAAHSSSLVVHESSPVLLQIDQNHRPNFFGSKKLLESLAL
jgi:hypothetical protein